VNRCIVASIHDSTIQQFNVSVSPEKITAVILAGGFGTRLKQLLPNLPKPMAPVMGKPFLEWLVRYLAKQGISSVVISTGYLADVVAAHFRNQPVPGVEVRCIAESSPLGTAGGILHAVNESGLHPSAWLLLNGDTIAFAKVADAISALRDESVAGAIFGREVDDTSRYGSLVTNAEDNLLRFEEKRPGKGLISTGVYLFRHSLVKKFPARTPLSIEKEVFPALTAEGVSLKVLRMNAPFLDIGTPDTLRAADAFIAANPGQFQLETV
jgi:D-glycero-alpha-D-manno-heptose 1-phosphate guanylyltransferase